MLPQLYVQLNERLNLVAKEIDAINKECEAQYADMPMGDPAEDLMYAVGWAKSALRDARLALNDMWGQEDDE